MPTFAPVESEVVSSGFVGDVEGEEAASSVPEVVVTKVVGDEVVVGRTVDDDGDDDGIVLLFINEAASVGRLPEPVEEAPERAEEEELPKPTGPATSSAFHAVIHPRFACPSKFTAVQQPPCHA